MIKNFFNKILSFFKYILFVFSFIVICYGVYKTYGRLDKNLISSFYILLPFILMFITLFIDLFLKNDIIKKNFLFNFVSCLLFSCTILICLRAQFDLSLVLNIKYNISYNSFFFSNNLYYILIMEYVLFGVNVLMIIYACLDNKNKVVEEVIAKKIY